MQTDPFLDPRATNLPSGENWKEETSNTDFNSAQALPVPISNINSVVLSMSFS